MTDHNSQWQQHIHNPFSDHPDHHPPTATTSTTTTPHNKHALKSRGSTPSNNTAEPSEFSSSSTFRPIPATPSTPTTSSTSSTGSRESDSKTRRRHHSISESTRRFLLPDVAGNWWTAFGVCICHIVCWLFGCCGQGRKCTRKQKAWWLVIVTILITFLLTIFISIEMYNAGAEPHILAWFSGGMCVLLAVPISVFEIFWHLVYFSNPSLQRYVIRILWMVPIYGVESWFALRYTENAVYLQAFREFYEAYVIWSFLHFLTSFLGDQEADIVNLLQRKQSTVPTVEHLPPFCCLKPWRMGREFFYQCKSGVVQYVVIKIFTTTLTVICVNNNVYGEGELFNLFRGYFYIVFIDNFSQLWALYCLAMFYSGLKKELQPIKPFSKFLSVKAIVFFSWWQGFFIQIAVSTGYITHTAFYTKDNVARALQNWLVCIEMLLFAFAHKYAFSYKEFVDVRDPSARNFLTALFDSTVPVDFIMDMRTFAHTFESVPSTEVVDGSQHSEDEDDDDENRRYDLSIEEERLIRLEKQLERDDMGVGSIGTSSIQNTRSSSGSKGRNRKNRSRSGRSNSNISREADEADEADEAEEEEATVGNTKTENAETDNLFDIDSLSNGFEFRRNSAFDLETQNNDADQNAL